MRSLPLLLALLVVATGLTLGLSVMFDQKPGTTTKTGAVEYRNGLPQGHVYCGVTSEPDDVNPFTCHGNVARRFVVGLTHEGLLDTDPVTGALRGAVAEAWQLAEDGMSCTFTLRGGVVFSDGKPVTMADVLFGWELAQAGHVAFGFVGDAYGRVAAAAAIDERRLRVTFKQRHYAAVRAVGERWLVCQRAFFADRVGAMAQRLGEAVPAVADARFAALLQQIKRDTGPGTGPMQLPSGEGGAPSWRQRQDLSLLRNEHHWRREAVPGTWNVAGMRLLFREGPAVFNALLAGEIDWLGGWSVPQAFAAKPELAERYVPLIYDYETLGVIGIRWNCRNPALADRRVRRALTMLVDRDAVVRQFEPAASAAMAFAKPDSPAYPTRLAPLPYEPAAADRLLREAGFDPASRPLVLRLLAVRDGGPMDLATTMLIDAAKGIGVKVTVDRLKFNAYVARKKLLDWDGLVVQQSFRPWGDPFDYVHSAGMDNDGNWQHEEADRLAASARAEPDAEQRHALWLQLHAIVHAEQPFTFVVHPRSSILFNKHIQQAEPGPRGLWPERWWVAPEHQRR